MRIFFHLLRYEIEGRKFWLLASALAGLLVWQGLRYFSPLTPGSMRLSVLGTAAVLTLGFATLGLGYQRFQAGMLTSRMFEMARPLTASQLASSKLVAGALIGPACVVLVLLPSLISMIDKGSLPTIPQGMQHLDRQIYENVIPEGISLASGRYRSPDMSIRISVPILWWLLLGALPISLWLTGSLTINARSWLSAIDVACWVLFLWLAFSSFEIIKKYDSYFPPVFWMMSISFVFIMISHISNRSTWMAGVLLRDVHTAYARKMNVGLLTVSLTFFLWAHCLGRPTLTELEQFSCGLPVDGGRFWIISGKKGYAYDLVYLADSQTGSSRFLGNASELFPMPRISSDGNAMFRNVLAADEESQSYGLWQIFSGEKEILVESPLIGYEPFGQKWDFNSAAELVELKISPGIDLVSYQLPYRLNERRIPLIPRSHPIAGLVFGRILHIEKSKFEALVVLKELDGNMSVHRARYNAALGRLEDQRSWSLASNTPQAVIPNLLPLLEQALPIPDISRARRVVVAENGETAVLDRDYRLALFDRAATLVRSHNLAPRSVLAGEIREGLILVGVPFLKERNGRYQGRADWILGGIDDWQTWIIDSGSGEILRKLQGFVPMSHSEAGTRVWLIDKNGEPFDLDSADSEPRPILPFRPRLAAQ